jgi:hypothetical protein
MGDNQSKNADLDKKQEEGQNLEKEQSAKTNDKNIDSQKGDELNLTEEQWEKVFQHPRFSQLSSKAKEAEKELEKIRKAKEKEDQDKLKEEGKFQELLEAKEKEIENLQGSISELKLTSGIMSVASKLNVVDTDAVARLIDRSKLEADKDSGEYTNVEDVVKELLTEKPYLAKEGSNVSSNIGSGSNATTGSQNGNFVITKSELTAKLQDHSWYEEHKDEIVQWQKEGRIDMTR